MKKNLTSRISRLLLLLVLLGSCKSYYNDTIDWMNSIKPGTTLEEVKKTQPDFIEIDWNKPDTVNGELRFRIVAIKGNNDVLAMEHYLLFSDNKFLGRASSK